MKSSTLSTITMAVIFCFIVLSIIAYPSEAYQAALDGLKLWLNVVCPALLPFFICIEILIGLGVVSLLGGMFKGIMKPVFNVPGEASFAFFMSISSGYPVGSKITTDLRLNKKCSQSEGQRMLSLCSTSGPLFIIGAVATGILGNPSIGFLLAVSHYLSAIAMGFIMRFYKRDKSSSGSLYRISPLRDMLDYRKRDNRSLGVLMGDAVKSGVNLILMIGGFIIFFSVITAILKISGVLNAAAYIISSIIPFVKLDQKLVSCVIVGMLEVTNGIKECAALKLPAIIQAILVSFMIGFGGLSVNAQVLSIISETDLSFGLYLFLKLLQGAVASFLTFVLSASFVKLQFMQESYAVLGRSVSAPYSSFYWLDTMYNSFISMGMMLTFIMLIGLIASWQPLKSKNKRQSKLTV